MKLITRYIILLTLLFSIGNQDLYAQYTKITGVVVDSVSNEPIPFVNVYLKGTSIGATTGFDGRFIVKTQINADTLVVSYIGYESQQFRINKGAYQDLRIKLQSSNFQLAAVDIHPGENPAHILLRKVIAHKKENAGYDLDAYEYEVYNKVQMDANNITEEFKERNVFKPFQFVFENVDTSTINGKTYLPLLMTESLSDYYYRKSPTVTKEIVNASRASGINNESIAQFLGTMYQDINIYDNYMNLFDKNFTSPIADFGLRTYRYYLIDSANIDGHWCYQLMFKPKRKQETTYVGEIWIADTTFAVKRVNMKVEKVNLNFVNAMSIIQEYKRIDNQYWMITRDNFVVDFNLLENTKRITGFYAHKTAMYRNFTFNKIRPNDFYKSATLVDLKEDAWGKSEEFWDSTRFEDLNIEEEGIYEMIDTITNMPTFKRYYNTIAMLTSGGYYPFKYIEPGPFYKVYSYNAIEESRFRIGGRTSSNISSTVRLYGHLAYGTRDQRFKFGLGATIIQKKNPRRAIDIYYKNDMEQLGASINALSTDNVLASLLSVAPNDKLTMVREYKLGYEYEYFNGFSNTLTFRHRTVSPLEGTLFEVYPDGPESSPTFLPNITTSEIELKTHFAFREMFFYDKFNRMSLGSDYPSINLYYSYGIPDFLNSNYEYHKLHVSVNQWFNVLGIGYSKYIVAWGKTWGVLPYNLLEVHPGNQTFVYDPYAYNGLNYYEFISDEFLSLSYMHNFQGLFLNHVPLIRKLKWREVIYGKALFGSLRNENSDYSAFPDISYEIGKPYYEAGFAIENIFKVLRVDFGWRLSYLNHPDVKPFRVRINLHMDF